jgi:hypothetical protein
MSWAPLKQTPEGKKNKDACKCIYGKKVSIECCLICGKLSRKELGIIPASDKMGTMEYEQYRVGWSGERNKK